MVQSPTKQIEPTQAPHYALLQALYDLYCENGQNLLAEIWLEDAAKIAGLKTWPDIMAAASYLSEKKFIGNFDPTLQEWAKLTVRGIEYVEKSRKPISIRGKKASPTSVIIHNHNSPGANFNLGSGNIQQSWLELTSQKIDSATATSEEKREAKSLLTKISENKLLNTIIGSAIGSAVGGLTKAALTK
jgi:hypothetical protein